VREALKTKAESLGFARARVTTPEPAARLEAYKAWVADGKHGEMG
jgi:epoxyqueuosine reductase QueG